MTSHRPPPSPPGSGAPAHGDAERLWEALEPSLPGLSVEVVERLDSTNTELTGRLRRATGPDDVRPQLLVARQQDAGRGRLGRRWFATPGASLTFSLALPLARDDWSGLSLAVGLAVADALEPQGRRLGLKWPNDLVLREAAPAPDAPRLERKLGGILIESVLAAGQRVAVIGIGLNVGTQDPVETDYGCAALTELWPALTPTDTLARIALPLAQALRAFERQGFAPCATEFARRDVLRGRLVRTSDPSMPEGVAAGVDTDGALRVAAGGRTQRILSGEVSVRLAPSA